MLLGKELPGELQHKSRTGGSLAKPALCCHTPGLQINVGARGQPGKRGGNRSVAHHSKLGQQQRGVGVAKNSTRNIECPAALLQPGLMWPDQVGIYWHGRGNENLD